MRQGHKFYDTKYFSFACLVEQYSKLCSLKLIRTVLENMLSSVNIFMTQQEKLGFLTKCTPAIAGVGFPKIVPTQQVTVQFSSTPANSFYGQKHPINAHFYATKRLRSTFQKKEVLNSSVCTRVSSTGNSSSAFQVRNKADYPRAFRQFRIP